MFQRFPIPKSICVYKTVLDSIRQHLNQFASLKVKLCLDSVQRTLSEILSKMQIIRASRFSPILWEESRIIDKHYVY